MASQKEVDRLEEELAEVKSDLRGTRTQLTNLRNRATALLKHLDEYVVPTLKTTRQQQCVEAMDAVKSLVDYE